MLIHELLRANETKIAARRLKNGRWQLLDLKPGFVLVHRNLVGDFRYALEQEGYYSRPIVESDRPDCEWFEIGKEEIVYGSGMPGVK